MWIYHLPSDQIRVYIRCKNQQQRSSSLNNFFKFIIKQYTMQPSVIQTILLLICSSYIGEGQLFQVLIKNGPIVGVQEHSRSGRPYYSFRGIPYAKPPIGKLRFKAPEPPEKWTKPLKATENSPVCIQKNYFFADPKVEGQEDCLYLNVYSPLRNSDRPLPVMVFIHWGGFLAGRGTSDYLDPHYFMDKDVVFVTFNYRLGLFGFLTTLDDAAPGNYALKDQVLALKWVQENIANFGGDSNMVTLFGQSAGAGSVHYHMLSPLSKGLFHRAICQSGNALAIWAKPDHGQQAQVTAAQASFVNCSAFIGDNNQLVDCLRNVPANTLMETQDQFKVFQVDPLTVYMPVIEKQTENNPDPFFTKTPLEYIQNKEFQHVPWIIGIVEEEGLLKVESYLRQTTTRNTLNSQFDVLFPSVVLGLQLSTNDTQTLYENIKQKYLMGNNYINISSDKSIKGFIDVHSDRVFVYSAYQAAMLHSALGHKPIWFYNFNYKGLYSYGDLFAATNETIDYDWGVSHCDDLLYLFKSPALFPIHLEGYDVVTSEVMVNIWTNFAIYGDPSPTFYNSCPLQWPTLNIVGLNDMKNENLCLMSFEGSFNEGLLLNVTCGFHKDRMNFWASQNLFENFGRLS